MIEIRSPLPQFFDTSGDPLDDGDIYIGIAGANPETSPHVVYWDKAGTIVATQPISTLNGYPSRDGAVSKFYTATKNYSLTVRNKRGELVYSVLNSDSGVFDELSDSDGAAGIGYDNATSGLAASDVQTAIDELKEDITATEALIGDAADSFTGLLNLFANSAFLINQRGYTSGTATVAANQYTLDRIKVVVSGESLTWTASSTFGNLITAPAGGAQQVIEGTRITGGEYACTWGGSGTILVNGVFREKGASFTLTAGANVTITMVGDFEKFLFTRPELIGRYEYDYLRDLDVCMWYTKRVLAVAGSGASNYYTSHFGQTTATKSQSVGPMRAVPTVSFLNATGIEYFSYAGAWTAGTISGNATGSAGSDIVVSLFVTADGDGRGKLIRKSSAGDVVAILSAEL